MYIENNAKLEDNKSTAYTFLLVGAAGLIFVILYAAGIIRLPLSDYMRVLMTVMLSILFIAFLGIGIIHFKRIKTMKEAADTEDSLTEEIKTWFLASFEEKESKAEGADIYFLRYEQMKEYLHTKYSGLEEEYEDHLLEMMYNELYPEKE